MSIHDPSEVPHVLTDAPPSQGAAAPSEEEPEKDNPPCWCGAENPHYDEDFLSPTCGGSGTLYCYCGGDLCVCHNHGEVDCYGCEDCGDGWDLGEDDGDYDCDGGGDPDEDSPERRDADVRAAAGPFDVL